MPHKFNSHGNKCISSIFHRLADTSLHRLRFLAKPNSTAGQARQPKGQSKGRGGHERQPARRTLPGPKVSHKLHEIINISSIKYKICKSFPFSFALLRFSLFQLPFAIAIAVAVAVTVAASSSVPDRDGETVKRNKNRKVYSLLCNAGNLIRLWDNFANIFLVKINIEFNLILLRY